MNASLYIQKTTTAKEIVEKHNENLDEADRLSWDEILKSIKKMGGTTENSLGEMTWEDIEDCGMPRLLARSVAKVFRTKEIPSDFLPPRNVVRLMTVAELLEHYDPNHDERTIIVKALKSAASAEVNFIVFDKDGTVDVDSSKKLWNIYRDTEMHSPISNLGGSPRAVYKVGEILPKLLDENPIIADRPLIDGHCDKSGVRWDDVPLEIRQFVRVVHDSIDNYPQNELVAKIIDFHDMVCDACRTGTWKNTMENLGKRYPEAWVSFDALKNRGKLPNLKIKTGKKPKSKKSNNPFGLHQEH